MPKKTLLRNVITGKELQDKIMAGVDKIEQVASAAYGNSSGNVLIENRYGEPVVSHDGITNVANLVVSDPVENSAISIIRQASANTDTNAGDATTATIILACAAYRYWAKVVSEGTPIRTAQQQMKDAVAYIVDKLHEGSIKSDDVTMDDLKNVATVSAGDEALGKAVAYAIESVGKNGGITVVEQAKTQVDVDIINGFSFKSGLKAVALASDLQTIKTTYENPNIVVIPKPISKNDEILPILDRLVRAGRKHIVLIADVSGQALETIVSNKLSGKLDIAVVEPPMTKRDQFISDVAFYCNTKPYTDLPSNFDVDKHVGTVDSAYITMSETVLNGTHAKGLDEYAKSIEDEDRRQMLLGRTARIAVGASTQAERQDTKLRVDDAVCATRTAQTGGIVYGGGVALKDIANDKLPYLDTPFFMLTNSDKAPGAGVGIDIMTGKTGNMRELGVMDSLTAIKEAVENAHSAASQLLSIKVALPFSEDME